MMKSHSSMLGGALNEPVQREALSNLEVLLGHAFTVLLVEVLVASPANRA